jgi:hypothetical protein
VDLHDPEPGHARRGVRAAAALNADLLDELAAVAALLWLAGCATARVHGSTYIARPPEDVFDTVADERNEPQYNPEMQKVELLTSEPVGAGSSFKVLMRSRGDPLLMTVTYTEFQRSHLVGSLTTTGSLPIIGIIGSRQEERIWGALEKQLEEAQHPVRDGTPNGAPAP